MKKATLPLGFWLSLGIVGLVGGCGRDVEAPRDLPTFRQAGATLSTRPVPELPLLVTVNCTGDMETEMKNLQSTVKKGPDGKWYEASCSAELSYDFDDVRIENPFRIGSKTFEFATPQTIYSEDLTCDLSVANLPEICRAAVEAVLPTEVRGTAPPGSASPRECTQRLFLNSEFRPIQYVRVPIPITAKCKQGRTSPSGVKR